MVSFKGKPKASEARILEESRAPKNVGLREFKIYSGNPKAKSGSGCLESCDATSRVVRGTLSTLGRKSAPIITFGKGAVQTALNDPEGKAKGAENCEVKSDIPVKVRVGRKALADVSNLNNVRSNHLKHQRSSGTQQVKVKSEGTTSQRVSLTKSVVVAKKSVRPNVKNLEESRVKHNISGEIKMAKRVVSNIRSARSSLRSQASDGSKFEKCQSGKLRWPRLSSASQKIVDVNNSSRKSFEITKNSKGTVKSGTAINVEKPRTIKPPLKTEVEAADRSNCDNNAPAVLQEHGLERLHSDITDCSNENVTAVTTRQKLIHRRSYTSSLMAKSEVLGESGDSVNKNKLPNIDACSNPLEVVEYVEDIYQYYWAMEVDRPLLANYMTSQRDITPRMRSILINWLIEVHLKFDLMQETLFLMVELLDRILSMITVRKDELQLVGLTALLLASKYEDFWHPKIKDLISISANTYTRDQMLAMENLILTKLRFRLSVPTPYVFMLRFLKAAQSDKKLEHLAFYLVELCLVEYEAVKFKPSLLCASAIYVARCTLQIVPAWSELLRKHARYEETQLRECANMILGLQRAASTRSAKVPYEKFLKPDRSCVAVMKAMDELPL